MRGLNFSFANTRSAIDMIIKSIEKVSKIVFYISQSLFAVWSIFLVIKNIPIITVLIIVTKSFDLFIFLSEYFPINIIINTCNNKEM